MRKNFIRDVLLCLFFTITSSSAENDSSCTNNSQPSASTAPAAKRALTVSQPQPQPPTVIGLQCSNQAVAMPSESSKANEFIAGKDKNSSEKQFDWNAFIHDIIWPLTIIFVALVFRRKLPFIIYRFLTRVKKIKHKDTELEFLSKEANESLAKAARGEDHLNIDAVFETVKLNQWATLIMARMLMRKALVEIADPNHSLGPSPSLVTLLERARRDDLVPVKLIDELERLREVTYYAEWWRGRAPSKGEWKWAVVNCKQIVEQLFNLMPIA